MVIEWNDEFGKVILRKDINSEPYEVIDIVDLLEAWQFYEADRKTEPQTCSVNGRPYDCGNCEYFRCTADEPQTDCVKVGKWYSFTDYAVEMQGDSNPKEFRIVPQTERSE